MYVIDVIGFIVSIGVIGLRYPHYVILASLINQVGQIIASLFCHLGIQGVFAAGLFSQIDVNGPLPKLLFVAASGIFSNYAAGKVVRGFEFEPSAHLWQSFAKLRFPFAVINMRFAFLMFCMQVFYFIKNL
ncbi:MAG: hypothetical protein E6713_16720 [Sporomusaceae bacterium]|nr:hypothetical protein [Sporomusaceae bacterium]